MLKQYKTVPILSLLTALLTVDGSVHACTSCKEAIVSPSCIVVEENTVLPYLRIDSGWSQFHRVSQHILPNKSKLTSNIHNVAGAGLGLGINFGDKVRADINWMHHIHPKFNLTENNFKINRKPLIDAAFFNLYYETGLEISILRPYIGAGAGVAVQKDKLSYYTYNNMGTEHALYTTPRKTNFAYRLMLGSAFDVTDRIKFDISYSYNDYGKSKELMILNNRLGKTHYRAHMISAGLRFGM